MAAIEVIQTEVFPLLAVGDFNGDGSPISVTTALWNCWSPCRDSACHAASVPIGLPVPGFGREIEQSILGSIGLHPREVWTAVRTPLALPRR